MDNAQAAALYFGRKRRRAAFREVPRLDFTGREVFVDPATGKTAAEKEIGQLLVWNSEEEYTFSLANDAGGLFAITDNIVSTAASPDGEIEPGSYKIVAEADDGVNPVLSLSFTIFVK